MHMKFKKLLVANRGEIAIRVFRAANEMGLRTVAVYAEEDKLSLHRFKADESYRIGEGLGPVKAYLTIEEMIRVAKLAGCDAIHPGYGFLSENPEFAEACTANDITFVGPTAAVMRSLGNKISARDMAVKAGTPVMPASGALPDDMAEVHKMALEVGYPVMLKASWGGGGRGMRVIETEDELEQEVTAGRREAESAFGNGEVYLEKLVRRARHVEVQLLGDKHGTVVHLFERDCTVQRRNQKVVERAPAQYLTDDQRTELCDAALRLARTASYECAGTAEFLMDADTSVFYFIEVNPRIQVEHTVTEEVTGIDIVKAQILIAGGGRIGHTEETGVPHQGDIHLTGHALQCRVTTEDPEANFIPDYGRINVYRSATGFGVRLDGGTAYAGAVITRYYDSLLEKVTCRGATPEEARARMDRALREFRIRGVMTNLVFVENLINHPTFKDASYTTRFIDETAELFHFPKRRDRATRLLNFIGEVIVNGNPEVEGRKAPEPHPLPQVPSHEIGVPRKGTRDLLLGLGAEGFSQWMKDQQRVLITDTTMRDGHQSLLATRMRTYDMMQVAESYAHLLPDLFSLECWGGATFDVSMRFLKECPWDRLRHLRERIPNVLFQMLLRGANGVGYANYPDNVVQAFVKQAADSGVDLFRVFDSLNWVENMRVAMDAVLESGKLLEGAICYTGNLLDPGRPKYDLDYYVRMARELEDAGCHIIGIKDMAGLCKPTAVKLLVEAVKAETNLPVHFHTHDTSGIAAASVLAAVDAGVDAVDAAMDSFSGLTSQPNLGSIIEALRDTDRDSGIDPSVVRRFSNYWEFVRKDYSGFESDLRFGASEVYLHEMPGGQFTNLKEQARSLGLEERWHEVAETYAEVNQMFGDIVKVTPSSKVVGDMALSMVSAGISRAEVEDPDREVAFPESVVSLFHGDLGQPPGGFPKALQTKILKGGKPISVRPGASVPPAMLDEVKIEVERKVDRGISDEELQSYLMYPQVFVDYAEHRRLYGPVEILPTPVFFYGMEPGQEIGIELEAGKTLNIRCVAIGDVDEEGNVKVFFELNGQPRAVRIANKSVAATVESHPKAEAGNPDQLPAPMPGVVASIAVQEGQKVISGDLLLTIEAMKMETPLHVDRDCTIQRIWIQPGTQVDAKDLLIEFS
ncbi:MAG: pyruvate carboxylase [Alphaproteobacteria bacterium]|nr:pyruvate carboxylase [Alphaproteobacteria bacterium]MBT4083496.1 pyruvate carboxylase [Alphaproteobacteria bacterium]MBT4544941.1 pyruvate carboxylase [Alphaproteobacteria bacterium]MBT7743700.1 pyruvate carboxylase [Alphaproteobacteria bacterium]